MESLVCIHKYLTVCKTDYLSPGFGDWLRGTVTLWNYCKKYGFELCIDKDIHPIFSHFAENPSLITDPNPERKVEEWFTPTPFPIIDEKIRELMEKKESFSIQTNGTYNFQDFYGPISRECKLWLKGILKPNADLYESIEAVYSTMGIDRILPYRVIHLRLGDNYLHQNDFDESYFKLINARIRHTLTTESEWQYILLCDTSSFGIELKRRNPQLFYWDNKKIHTGELQYDIHQIGVKDTLVDFFIMSKAIHILSLFDSGFSKMISSIYNITYYRI